MKAPSLERQEVWPRPVDLEKEEFPLSEDGILKLTASMDLTLTLQVVTLQVECRTPWVWFHKRVSEPFDGQRVSSGVPTHRIEWADSNGKRYRLFERMTTMVLDQVADALSASWFEYLAAQPVAGVLSVESLQEACDRLRGDAGLLGRAVRGFLGPSLVMNAHTLAFFQKNDVLRDRLDCFGPRWAMVTGEIAAWRGYTVTSYSKVEPGYVWVVSREGTRRGPIEARARLVGSIWAPGP